MHQEQAPDAQYLWIQQLPQVLQTHPFDALTQKSAASALAADYRIILFFFVFIPWVCPNI
jgi:hypothetical protein